MKQAKKWKLCRHLTFGIYGALGVVLVLLATLTDQGQISEWTMRTLRWVQAVCMVGDRLRLTFGA